MKRIFWRTLLAGWGCLQLCLASMASETSYPSGMSFRVVDLPAQARAVVYVELYANDVNMSATLNLRRFGFELKGGMASFELPLPAPLAYGRITLEVDGKKQHFQRSNNLFLFAQGDSVAVALSGQDLAFSGRGSGKFRCMALLAQRNYLTGERVQELYLSGRYQHMLEEEFRQIKAFESSKMSLLESFRDTLEPDVYGLLEVDLHSQRLQRMQAALYGPMTTTTGRQRYHDAIGKLFRDELQRLDMERFGDALLSKSLYYVDMLFSLNLIEAVHAKPGDAPRYDFRISFGQLDAQSQRRPMGKLVSNKFLLLATYKRLSINSDTEGIVRARLDTVGKDRFAAELLGFLGQVKNSIYGFELIDQNGGKRSLSEFRGKVLVLDFWFTGCQGCKVLALEMDPLIESYRGNSGVAFISVNIDRNIESWQRSLKEGAYTSHFGHNFYTGGDADAHPLVKHYNVTRYPTLLLIGSDGRLVTASPPYPQQRDPSRAVELRSMIDGLAREKTGRQVNGGRK